MPGAVVSTFAGAEQLLGQGFVVAHQARGMTAQGDHAGAGQGGDVDYSLGFEPCGVGQGVAQHQAAFGVGVEDFHGLPAHGADDIARTGGVTARHVFGARQQADQVDRQLQFQHGSQGAEHAGGAAHVVFHLVHAGARLEADTAGVEGDALADQHVGLLALFAALVVEHDQARGLCAALAHGQEGAHAQVLELFLVEDIDLEIFIGLAQVLGLLGQERRVADVRWQVAQVAGEAHAVGNRTCVLDGALDVGLVGLGRQQGDLFQGAGVGLLALETLERVFAVQQRFGQQARLAVGFATLDRQFVERKHGIAATQALEYVQYRGGQLAPGAITQFAVLTGADQQHAFGLEVGQAVQQ
ncbi:hypothetical protein D9M71_197860 [compost metagenome]